MENELYYGCYACGHEAYKGSCWECETDKYVTWLNAWGEHPSRAQLKNNRKKILVMKMKLKLQHLIDRAIVNFNYWQLTQRINKISKQAKNLNKQARKIKIK